MKSWKIICWQTLAVLCVLVLALAGFTLIVWRAQKIGGTCHDSDGSYPCKLISPTNLPTDYLVIVGIGGVFAAILTLKSIHHQAVQMRKQTKISKQNIELLISKERARLTVDFKPLNLQDRAVPDTSARLVEFTVSVYGPTAARILDSGVVAGIFVTGQENDSDLGSAAISPIPSLPNLILPNMPPLERETFLLLEESTEAEILEAVQKGDMVPVVRGFVRYQDIFGAIWRIRFRYYWGALWVTESLGLQGFWPDVSHGQWIKCGPAQDNQENSESDLRNEVKQMEGRKANEAD